MFLIKEYSKKYKEVLLNNEIDFEENQHTESKILNADVVMKSPGIPDKVALIQKLKENQFLLFQKLNLQRSLQMQLLLELQVLMEKQQQRYYCIIF